MKTFFASPERNDKDYVLNQYSKFSVSKDLVFMLDSGPELFMILNSNRQIVFANKSVMDFLGLQDVTSALGLRPGEAVSCTNAFMNEGGCGTSPFCKECGAVNSILEGLRGNKDIRECRIVTENNDALDLRVFTTPLTVENDNYIVFAVKDISDEKRKELLERIFFHDIMNTAGSLKGYAELMALDLIEPEEEAEFKSIVYDLTERIIDEIRSQKILTSAESNSLNIDYSEFEVKTFLEKFIKTFAKSYFAGDKQILISEDTVEGVIKTDYTILSRIMINLLKNASEASEDNDIIQLGVEKNDNDYIFWVHNNSVMPARVKLQIFQRSFSTKGSGRGIGTYSIKLLTEKYLKGKVYFISEENFGTRFYIMLPEDISSEDEG